MEMNLLDGQKKWEMPNEIWKMLNLNFDFCIIFIPYNFDEWYCWRNGPNIKKKWKHKTRFMGGPSYPPSRALRSSFTMSGSAPAYIYACEILPSLFTYIQANCILATLPYKFVPTLSNLCHIPLAVYSGFIRNEFLINHGYAIPCNMPQAGFKLGLWVNVYFNLTHTLAHEAIMAG